VNTHQMVQPAPSQ